MPSKTGIYNGGTSYQPPSKRKRGIASAKAPVGAQLAGKVKSGAITKQQAQQTAYERDVLAKAFGPNWRAQVFGKGGAQGIQGPFAGRRVAALRSKALEEARAPRRFAKRPKRKLAPKIPKPY